MKLRQIAGRPRREPAALQYNYIRGETMDPLQAERLRELALNISTANGLLRVLMTSGKKYADAEREYQEAVRVFDAELDNIVQRFWQE